ncbi:hypothetical protein Pst134EA_027682 [Puccinia striiformis f. sp. tritici]|uniref:hypothetical protein n=1 Tax=Puccinia striiformis f. sp. tritici TaxID=168172 RepID=UPI0020075985|nr:hypothetical protein Pst134EA_027682 [Puccinia striiformis f. sp. tritici]KAH9448370.1 hypothetical protein Pst134EA_027682 [Puccinia striiformis f. sp. tritici]
MPGPAPPPPPPAVPAAVPPGSAQSTKNSSSISGVSNRIDILDSEHGRILSQPTPDFALSEFPDLLSGKLKLDVPVYTVWGHVRMYRSGEDPSSRSICPQPSAAASSSSESAQTPERKQHGALSAYSIPNLTVLDEATTRCIVLGGIRLRLFGLGGAVVPHKLFDNGEGGRRLLVARVF